MAAGGSLCWQSDYSICKRNVGGRAAWLSVVPLALCACSERASEWGMAMHVRSWTSDTTCSKG